ncbi:hypothetical protein TCAL_16512 [Tigriopus californicus]|uniref:Uncharacterized protein n=1 Tax=Tigriopus californicus TaxID=6832 RepID=A0A553NUV1_TIGCA|nr:hypothetical protein TCAL_16512 [Tigriopus californicus]
MALASLLKPSNQINVQHRLLVYAYRNDVNVILPQTGNYVNNPKHKYVLDEPFRLEWLNGVSWHRDFVKNNEYGIQALHTKWNYTAYSNVQHRLLVYAYRNDVNVILPQTGNYVNNPKHKYVLDEPFRLEWLNGVSWHRDFVKNNEYGIQALHTKWNYTAYRLERNPTTRFERDPNKRGLNQQSWDLGMMGPDLEDSRVIEAKIQSMDQEFDLVMINEFMDESLVLLANLLCLPLSTMSGLKMNQRKSKAKVTV